MGKGARINRHHIIYEDPEWVEEITWAQHRVVTTLQSMKGTPENYAKVTNFLHSILYEWNRLRRELVTGKDLRIEQMKRHKSKKTKTKLGLRSK